MKKQLLLATLLGSLSWVSGAHALPNAPDSISAKGGAIKITPIFHASMQIEYGGKVIQVDPFSAGSYSGAKAADLILVTDIHPDHMDEAAIEKLLPPAKQVILVAPPAVAKVLQPKLGGSHVKIDVLAPGGSSLVAQLGKVGVMIQTLPMYNLVRGPKPGEKFHPKGRGDGFVLTIGGKRLYIAGDTEVTPEMKALKNIDVAFLPMNLPFTMTPQEAASGAKAFKPKVVYPYHYRYPFTKPNDNPQQFAAALKGSGITVRLRPWYANPAS